MPSVRTPASRFALHKGSPKAINHSAALQKNVHICHGEEKKSILIYRVPFISHWQREREKSESIGEKCGLNDVALGVCVCLCGDAEVGTDIPGNPEAKRLV